MNYKLLTIPVLFLFAFICLQAQPVHQYKENIAPDWEETIEHYSFLDLKHREAKLLKAGTTDVGRPLHLFIIDAHKDFDPPASEKRRKAVLLINNGIHPGEPCGIDASILLAREILENRDKWSEVLEKLTILIVPVHNVDGALNRSPFNRANQNGPAEQGFRANAQNMDLNRDFAKLDTRNNRSLVDIIRNWDPDVLVDTHTSNGSDYPYVLTLITTERNKLSPVLSEFLYSTMVPHLYQAMEELGEPMVPYVENIDRDPAKGIVSFMDYPRYTTGYASLFKTIGLTTEAHMFKPYTERVEATFRFLKTISAFTAENAGLIRNLRTEAKMRDLSPRYHRINWELDTSRYESLPFRGYKMKFEKSRVTGLETYYFDRNDVWQADIPWFTNWIPTDSVMSPKAYIVPQAWHEVIERLRINKVEMIPLATDTTIEVEMYYIESCQTSPQPYNGHYYHYNTTTRTVIEKIRFYAGDFYIPMNQDANEYLVHVLEPRARDSFFNWNFFDGILSRKEYFSTYIFDKLAEELLSKDPVLRDEFELKKKSEESFRNNSREQLQFIYERSPYSEKTYMLYPVARII